jgi:putative tricarboxylic transport membrane protein
MYDGIMIGLTTALSFYNLAMVVLGCVIGTFIGMLPGLGPMSIIAIMIPVAIQLGDPAAALILLAGVYYGAIFGGSTSSILINAPGVAGTVATSFDGYPLARKGQAGKALTIAAIASFSGGTIGAIILFGFAPVLSTVAKLFWSSEYFALMVVGLTAIAAFAGKGGVLKAMLMTVFGVMLATVGESALHNAPRFTLGIMDLQSGVYFVTLVMGLFAIPEALFLVMNPARSAPVSSDTGKITNLRINKAEAKIIAPPIARQSLIGFLIGVMPGAGATIASFLGYAIERNMASPEDRKEFGKGSLIGLAAPEAANNAACTGSFVPLLTLGIPGSGTTAILLGALIALNVSPGPQLMQDRPEVFWAVIISMYMGNVVLLILNLPLIPYIAKLLAVPRNYLVPFVLFFALIGAYIGQNNPTELFMMVGLGVLATVLRFTGFPLAPMVIGFILGGMLEDNLGRAIRKSNGFDFMWERPMTLGLLILAVVLLVLPFILDWVARKKREKQAP